MHIMELYNTFYNFIFQYMSTKIKAVRSSSVYEFETDERIYSVSFEGAQMNISYKNKGYSLYIGIGTFNPDDFMDFTEGVEDALKQEIERTEEEMKKQKEGQS